MTDYFSAIPFSMLLNNKVAKSPRKAVEVEAFISSSDNKSNSYWFDKPSPKWEIKTTDNKDEYKIKVALIINCVLLPNCL